jgi:hypothetical protein
MQNSADPRVRWPRAISVLLLLFVLLYASFACAAMTPGPSASAHPCCPKSGHSNSGNCETMGCFSTIPVLLSILVDMSIDLAVVGPVASPAPVADSLSQRVTETALSYPPDQLYLIHHRFLI